MSEYIRREDIEDSFHEMHGFKPKVDQMRVSRNEYRTKVSYNNKSVILTEVLEKGLTKDAILEYSGKTEGFPSMHAAECHAANILRS